MTRFTAALLNWFEPDRVFMPWRGDNDPYRVWLSEIMLQQTQVETVIPYYERWLRRFPNVHSVAEAHEDEVLKLWEGLGYYARARNFHHSCKILVEKHRSQIPGTPEKFRKLKGVGPYICSAVQSIAFGHPMPVIDGNVRRITARLLELDGPPEERSEEISSFLKSNIPVKFPGHFNEALMDLARYVCRVRTPLCERCPVSEFCLAYVNNHVDKYPLKKKKPVRPHQNIAVGVIWNGDKILVSRRPSKGLLGGLWEFPGGKIIPPETPQECVLREVREELGISVQVGDMIARIQHGYTHFSITLKSYHCRYVDGQPEATGCDEWRWISPSEISSLAFPGANHKFFHKIPERNPFND